MSMLDSELSHTHGALQIMCVINIGIFSFFFFFNDTATTEIYTLSLHDALPICGVGFRRLHGSGPWNGVSNKESAPSDRKSTRLNSSHMSISYAVFCLKKKK